MKEETTIKGVEKRMTYQIEVKKDTVVMMLDTIQGNGYQAEEMLGEGKIDPVTGLQTLGRDRNEDIVKMY